MTLQLRAINKRFGERQVLHQLDLDVANGECVALLGASGCGKSTALRLIAGLDHPDQGSIRINGAEVVDVPAERRRVGMVFQSYALFPHLNVWDNLELGLRMRGSNASSRDERIRGVLDVLQLSEQARQRPSQLSGGQRQRVALARALLRDPLVYLLDEPMSNLDAQLREDLRPQLRRLMIGGEQPVVYVTHDQQEAMALADRIAVMREGRIEQIGTPRELYLQPASTYVAQFIGRPQMNLLPARDGVITGIRPDDLRLDPAGSPCTILSREWFGCLLYTSPSPRDRQKSRMPSSA